MNHMILMDNHSPNYTNKAAHGCKGALVAMIREVASKCIIDKLSKIYLSKRLKIKTVTSDLSGAMKYIAQKSFPRAQLINDRFHVQQLMSAAIEVMQIELRWKVIEAENARLKKCRRLKSEYKLNCIAKLFGKSMQIEGRPIGYHSIFNKGSSNHIFISNSSN